jgi:hypothetical protein
MIFCRKIIVIGVIISLFQVLQVQLQLTPVEINDLRTILGNRIEAATILGASLAPMLLSGFSHCQFRVNKMQ